MTPRKSVRLDLADLRADLDAIAGWIQPGERVLDLGCGDGLLLRRLMDEKQVIGYGIEKDPAGVLACLKSGVNVIQVNLERGLAGFEDGAFDHVIMSLSLQMIQNTVGLLKELLRVGHEAVVSFPNFGYYSSSGYSERADAGVGKPAVSMVRYAECAFLYDR